jgi:hypothetical protein
MVATTPLFTDLTKLPPKAGTFVNDTTLPKAPKASLGTRMGKAIAPHLPGVGTIAKGLGKAAFPLALAQSASSEVASEDRLLPNFGNVADGLNILGPQAYKEGGILPAVGEYGKSILPAVGGLMKDIGDSVVPDFVHDMVADFKGLGPNLGPGIQHTPGAVEGLKTGIPYKPAATPPATPAATTSTSGSGSAFDKLLLARLGGQGQPAAAPVAPTPNSNDSYFINNQTGEAPGEKQLFRDLPGTSLQPTQQLPARPGEQGSAYESPMVAAANNLNLPQFDLKKDSYSDVMNKRMQMVNETGKLMPALAQTREVAEQQRRGEVDRELTGRNDRSNLDNIVRLRNQDVASNARRDLANTAANKPMTNKQLVEDQDAQLELSRRQFPDAPSQFADAVPTFMQEGYSLKQVQDAYDWVSAIQVQNTGTPVNELDAKNLYAGVRKRLGGG